MAAAHRRSSSGVCCRTETVIVTGRFAPPTRLRGAPDTSVCWVSAPNPSFAAASFDPPVVFRRFSPVSAKTRLRDPPFVKLRIRQPVKEQVVADLVFSKDP